MYIYVCIYTVWYAKNIFLNTHCVLFIDSKMVDLIRWQWGRDSQKAFCWDTCRRPGGTGQRWCIWSGEEGRKRRGQHSRASEFYWTVLCAYVSLLICCCSAGPFYLSIMRIRTVRPAYTRENTHTPWLTCVYIQESWLNIKCYVVFLLFMEAASVCPIACSNLWYPPLVSSIRKKGRQSPSRYRRRRKRMGCGKEGTQGESVEWSVRGGGVSRLWLWRCGRCVAH